MIALVGTTKYLMASHSPYCADLIYSRVTPTVDGEYPVGEIIRALMHSGIDPAHYLYIARTGWTHVRFVVDLPSPSPSFIQ